MWFPRWKPLSEVDTISQLPPEQMSTAVAVQKPLQSFVEDGRETERTATMAVLPSPDSATEKPSQTYGLFFTPV
jgi:hypothetical protein